MHLFEKLNCQEITLKEQNPPIRVLRLIARMNVGGPAIQISGLMKNLPKDKFEQLLATGYCDENELDLLFASDLAIPVTRVSGFGRGINVVSEFRAFLQIRKLIKEFDPHVVHTHTAKAGVLGRVAALSIFKSRVRIHTFHGHLLHGYFGSFKTSLVILIERILAVFTQELVAVGKKVRDDLISAGIGNTKKFTVIGPGLEIQALPDRKAIQSEFGLQSNQFTISWVGRLVPVKAPLRMIEIARACNSIGLPVRFLIVGDGPLGSSLKNIALEEDLPIKLLGWQSEIEKILAITDLMLLTSLNEGMPVSLIEAQMAGIPVISTNVGSASEVIVNGKSGYCLDYSAIEFAKLIEKLVSDTTQYNKFSSAARLQAQNKFSLNRLVDDYSQLYSRTISQANS